MKCPLVPVVVCFGLGIVINEFIQFSFALICLGILLSFLGILLLRRVRFFLTVFLLILFVSLGVLYAQSRQFLSANHINKTAKFYYGQEIEVKGHIVSDVDKRELPWKKTILTLKVEELQTPWGWQKKTGKILVHIFRDCDFFYGDRLLLKGKFHRPFDFATTSEFSYRDYLRYRGIEWILSVKKSTEIEKLSDSQPYHWQTFFYRLRQKWDILLAKYLLKNEASIMQMLLLGDRSQIPKHIRDLFTHTGTTHILAISGLHVTLIAGLFLVLMKLLPIGRKAQLIAAITLIILYTMLTGFRPSVVRATIMAIVFLGSFLFERKTDSLNNLALAALIILLVDPFNLFDIGFQLSFMCVFWIIAADKKVKEGLNWIFGSPDGKISQFLISAVSISISALVGASGLIAYYFSIVTPVAILANVVIVPLSEILIALGMGLLCAGSLFPQSTFLFANCVKFTLNFMVGMTFLFDKIPYGYFWVKNVTLFWTLVYYLVVTALFFLPWGRIFRRRSPLLS